MTIFHQQPEHIYPSDFELSVPRFKMSIVIVTVVGMLLLVLVILFTTLVSKKKVRFYQVFAEIHARVLKGPELRVEMALQGPYCLRAFTRLGSAVCIGSARSPLEKRN